MVQDHAAVASTYKSTSRVTHSCYWETFGLKDGSNIVVTVKRLSLTCSKMAIYQTN
jgi:hypothetical protein